MLRFEVRARTLWLIVVALVAASPTPSWADERDFQLSFSDAWRRILQVMALDGLTITQSDKDAGIVQATGTFAKNVKMLSCKSLRGHVESYSYTIAVVLSPVSESTTRISVSAKGSAKSIKNNHLLFIKTGHTNHETACESTGVLEADLLTKIAGP